MNASQTYVKTKYSPRLQPDQPASQIPNQEFYVKLDNALNGKPREIYVSKLLGLCYSHANTIRWYRSILASRAQSVPSCLVSVLKARRKTAKSSYEQKLASDCYIISMCIDGDTSNVNRKPVLINTVENRVRWKIMMTGSMTKRGVRFNRTVFYSPYVAARDCGDEKKSHKRVSNYESVTS